MPDDAAERTPDRELSSRECWDRLRSQAYGRLAVVDGDGPMIYPINATVDHGTLVFRTGAGEKLEALHDDDRVAFEIDGLDVDADEAWSVVLRGSAQAVTNQYEDVEVVELGLTPWQGGPKSVFVRIVADTVSGRQFSRVDRKEWQLPDHVQPRPSPDE